MSESHKCPGCGAKLPSDSPGGHCISCLLQLGLAADPAAEAVGTQASVIQINPQAQTLTEKPGDRIGRYKLLQQIGEGGYGVVYMAEQAEPVRRRVALKVIKLGMDTKQVIARFEAERQALALMDHPNIAKVLDAGATQTGRPYFVMELVRGVKITDYCDQQRLSTRQRLELFVRVCQAVQHAHQKGVIHRDLKPSNILVTELDGNTVPKVIDFGIAKATTVAPLTDKTLFTAFDQFIGTPAYMSPEQAGLGSLDIDTRSDVYSLGVLLYELLTGKQPFDSAALRRSAIDEILRIIREQEPPRPSACLTTLTKQELTIEAQRRQTEPAKFSNLLRGDLDWIVMKTLEKDRTRRYQTANGLAADLQRHLKNEPVVARPPSNFYRLQKWVRRNKLAFIAASAVIAMLVIGLVTSTWLFFREQKAHQQAMKAEQEQSRLRETAQDAQVRETEMRQLAESRERIARRNAYASDLIAAHLALEDGNFGLARILLDQHQPEPNQEDLRDFEWRYLWGKSRGEQIKTLIGHSNTVDCIAYSPDGTMLVSGSLDHTVKLWNASTGGLIANCAGHSAAVISVAFSRDGKIFASGGNDRLVRLWDARTYQIVLTITNPSPYLAFSDSLLAIATGGDEYGEDGGTVQLWNYATGQKVAELPESGNRAAFSPDGKTLATANWEGLIKLWNLDNQKPFRSFSSANVRSLAFSPDGRFLAWDTGWKGVELWELTKEQPTMLLSQGHPYSVAFSPDSHFLAVANQSYDVGLWDVSRCQKLRSLFGHGNEVCAVAFSPDGKSLASGSRDETIMFWNLSGSNKPPESFTNIRMPRWDEALLPIFSPDERNLAAATVGGGVRLWDTTSGQANVGRDMDGFPIAFSPDGKSLFTRNESFTTLQQWDVATQSLIASVQVATPKARIFDSAFSPDGKMIAISQPQRIVLCSAITGEFLFALAQPRPARCLTFSPDSQTIAAGYYDLKARLWDLSKRQVVWTVTGFRDTVSSISFSTNGLFAAASWDGTIKICNANAKKELMTLVGHKSAVVQLAFSNDARTLASGSDDFTVKLWNLAIGREIITFKTDAIEYFIRFAPGDKILATGGSDGVVHFWRAPSTENIAAAEVNQGEQSKIGR